MFLVILQEIWLGLLYHVTGEHVWPGGCCKHEEMAKGSVGDDKPILAHNSDAWRALRDIVDDKKLLTEMSYCADFL